MNPHIPMYHHTARTVRAGGKGTATFLRNGFERARRSGDRGGNEILGFIGLLVITGMLVLAITNLKLADKVKEKGEEAMKNIFGTEAPADTGSGGGRGQNDPDNPNN